MILCFSRSLTSMWVILSPNSCVLVSIYIFLKSISFNSCSLLFAYGVNQCHWSCNLWPFELYEWSCSFSVSVSDYYLETILLQWSHQIWVNSDHVYHLKPVCLQTDFYAFLVYLQYVTPGVQNLVTRTSGGCKPRICVPFLKQQHSRLQSSSSEAMICGCGR